MNLAIWGIDGKMGQMIVDIAKDNDYWTSIEGVSENIPVSELSKKPDIVIDFSHPTAINEVVAYCRENSIPLVIGTTGFTEEGLKLIEDASLKIPILKATNMSIGMNILFSLVEQAARILKNRCTLDIEVIESHHNRKKDAPSGSAKTIVASIEKGLGEERKHVFGRSGQCPREKGEIGVHAIRGGNIVGVHEVDFIGEMETIKITHEAYDRSIYARGALQAAKFLIDKPSGMYNIKDVLNIQ
ncbi:dihydrodipicolinate reductase [Anaerovirgula multivorans]|uniref:4-hydroxy-tetrahydrodipicolinate reductase n=1 Tax=Anaerovirgula multivorans TaxID=312168 RepID=A0A239B8Y3_9FIRM|nr:4-hydroxy-tetrahydrodipicolinate reductase [Anaerovirgula multivorans]SNS03553.1 dihydrodipicolinate reductase [Anaerovirgula multivorans]